MGTIKDIVDLAKDLESRAKDRKDIDTLRAIVSLTQTVQAHDVEVVERDIRVMQENANLVAKNAELERQLAEAQSEDIRIHRSIEFRRGKRTGGQWMAFCPKCHMPAGSTVKHGALAACTAACGWVSGENANNVGKFIQEL